MRHDGENPAVEECRHDLNRHRDHNHQQEGGAEAILAAHRSLQRAMMTAHMPLLMTRPFNVP